MNTNKNSAEKGVESSSENKFEIPSSPPPKAKKVTSPSKDQFKVPSPPKPKKVISLSKAKLKSPPKISPESILKNLPKIPSQQIETDTVVRVSSRISERKKAIEKSLDSETTTASISEEKSPKQEKKTANEGIVTEDIEQIPPQSTTDVPTRVSSRISERKKRALDKPLESEATNSTTSEETNSKQKEEAAKNVRLDIVSQDIEETTPQTTTEVPTRVSSRISVRKKRALDESCKSAAETSSASEEKNPKQKEEAVKKDIATEDVESSSEHEEATSEDEDSETDSQADEPRHKVNIEIGDTLKKLLEQDFDLINNKNMLIALPARPTVISILESWVLDHTTALIEKMSNKRHKNSEAPDIIDETIVNINLCREMADGVRVYFDYTLAGLLLYAVERDQCNSMMLKAKAVSVPLVLQESITIKDKTNESNITVEKELRDQHKLPPSKKNYEDKENENKVENTKQETENVSSSTKTTTKSPQKEPNPSEPLEERKQETENVSSSASTSSKSLSPQGLSLRSSSSLINSDLVNELTEKAKIWRLVKDDKIKSSMPSNIYGAIHLGRLFVQLPDLLGRSELTKAKLKVVLKYIHMFLSFLENREEWFGEQFYMLKTSFKESNTN